MLTHSLSRDLTVAISNDQKTGAVMSFPSRILFAAFVAAVMISAPIEAFAQSGDAKPGDKPPAGQAADPAKDSQKRADEFAEAAAQVTGPAGNPECVWLGRRVVNLLWRDDLDTAFRHLDLYDRFGCPGQHIQATFRCVVRKGTIDPKAPESLSARVHTCWLNPASPPPSSTSASNPAPATGTTAK
jgi:hypothetical protein